MELPEPRADGKCAKCCKKPAITTDKRFCKCCLRLVLDRLTPPVHYAAHRSLDHRENMRETRGADSLGLTDYAVRVLEDTLSDLE